MRSQHLHGFSCSWTKYKTNVSPWDALFLFIWFFTSQSTIFQLCRDGSSWVSSQALYRWATALPTMPVWLKRIQHWAQSKESNLFGLNPCWFDSSLCIGAVWSESTLYTSILKFVSNVRRLFAADDIFMSIFVDALRVKAAVQFLLAISVGSSVHTDAHLTLTR